MGDVFSGLSLSIEKPYRVGTEILLEGGAGTFTASTSGLLLELCAKDLKPILESRPELMESLSHSATKAQQSIAMFDKAAIQPIPIEQHDLLSRIKTFFHLELQ